MDIPIKLARKGENQVENFVKRAQTYLGGKAESGKTLRHTMYVCVWGVWGTLCKMMEAVGSSWTCSAPQSRLKALVWTQVQLGCAEGTTGK